MRRGAKYKKGLHTSHVTSPSLAFWGQSQYKNEDYQQQTKTKWRATLEHRLKAQTCISTVEAIAQGGAPPHSSDWTQRDRASHELVLK